MFSFSSDKFSEIKLLDYMVVQFFNFWGNYILFSIVAAPIYILTNSTQSSLSYMLLPTLVISYLFDNSHSDKCEL